MTMFIGREELPGSAHLYINSKGKAVRSHSFSAGDTYHFCPQKYKLQRIDGWQEKGKKASLEFGKAVESAVQFHHENRLSGGPEEFARLWKKFELEDLTYTAAERDWEALAASGVEMLKLYNILLPTFPIDLSAPIRFQVKYFKELFPGTELKGIEFVAWIDAVTKDKHSISGQRFWDIKTSAAEINTTPGIIALDQQLRSYAWITGIPDGGFLQFIKTNRSLERGSFVHLLTNSGDYEAGQQAVVIKYQEAEEFECAEEIWIVREQAVIDNMFAVCGSGQKKAEKEAREAYIRTNGTLVDRSIITKQRVKIATAHFSLSDQVEVAKQIGQDVAQIVYAGEENFFPKSGGVRFPNNKCGYCAYRGICLENNELRDQFVFRTDEEWETVEEGE